MSDIAEIPNARALAEKAVKAVTWSPERHRIEISHGFLYVIEWRDGEWVQVTTMPLTRGKSAELRAMLSQYEALFELPVVGQ